MKRKIKLICFDLNKTLINENSWLDLNLAMGMTKEEDEKLFKQWKNGEITYNRWQEFLTGIYKKRGQAFRKNILKSISSYSYKTGVKEIIEYLHKRGYIIALISSAMDLLIKKVAKELNIELFRVGNEFRFDKDGYLDKINSHGQDSGYKLQQLKEICRELGIKITECACIGDGDNDKLLFEKTKHGITFKGSKLEPIAWKVIGNLFELKDIFCEQQIACN